MVAMPAEIPVTLPVDEPIVATAVLLLSHAPPDVASLKVGPGIPRQREVRPAIGAIANKETERQQSIEESAIFFIF